VLARGEGKFLRATGARLSTSFVRVNHRAVMACQVSGQIGLYESRGRFQGQEGQVLPRRPSPPRRASHGGGAGDEALTPLVGTGIYWGDWKIGCQ